MKTRERILTTALEMFNEHGVHSVGVREIARELGISPGNLQYHFSRKDALISELIRRLHTANQQRVDEELPIDSSFGGVYRLTYAALAAHIPYRGLILSYPEVVSRSEDLQRLVQELNERRPREFRKAVARLVEADLVDPEALEGRRESLRIQLEGLGRFWLAQAILDGQGDELETAARRRALLMLRLFYPYATPRGRSQLDELAARFEAAGSDTISSASPSGT